MLWEIVGTPHRLIGSTHHLPEIEFPDWITQSRKGIKRFVFERDNRDFSDDGLGIDHTGEHLKFSGASEIYQRANKFLISLGHNELIEPLVPWRAAFHVQTRVLQKLGHKHANGVEKRFRTIADIMKYSVEFLESPKRSFELIDLACRPENGGLAYLADIVADGESGTLQLQFQNSFDAWLNRRFEAYIATRMDDITKLPYIYDAIILQRNREWVARAKRLLSETIPTLFIVGALHNVGSGSFIELLEAGGFRFKLIA